MRNVEVMVRNSEVQIGKAVADNRQDRLRMRRIAKRWGRLWTSGGDRLVQQNSVAVLYYMLAARSESVVGR
jgi:hypothetical protein